MKQHQWDEFGQTLFEESSDGLFLFEPESTQLVEVNPMAQRLSGYPRQELLNMSVKYLFRSEQPGCLASLHHACRSTQLFHAQEGFFLRHQSDGVWIPVNVTVTRLHARPRTLGLITARDISERKRAEAAVRASEQRYRALFDASPLPLLVHDPETLTFFMVNDAAVSLYGYTHDEFLRLTLEDIRVREDLTAAPPLSTPATAATCRHRKKDGTPIDVEISARDIAVGDRQGRLVLVLDVTERRRAEALRSHLIAILEATTDLVAITHVDGMVTYLNPAGRQLLGGDAEARTMIRAEARHIATHHGVWSGETVLASRAGHEIPVSQVVITHKGPDGAVEYLSTIARDMSEWKQLEEQMRQAQKMEAIGQLAGGVAHDFNNLLTVIIGYSDMLLGLIGKGSDLYDMTAEIKRAGERAEAVTRQLLAFSRRQILAPVVLNVNAVLTEVGKMLRRLIGEHIELVTELDPALRQIKTDPGQLEQIIMNLAVNARDAMPQGGKLLLQTANAVLTDEDVGPYPEVQPGRYIRLNVCDTGCGMTEEVKARIFEPFFTTKEVGKGTGLGLATVYGIVKQSEGHITVASAPGKGTTFAIYLPTAARSEVRLATATVPNNEAAATTPEQTVLLVEDEDNVRALARLVLERRGYTVLEACCGQDALRLNASHKGPIHLLVTDVVMPRMGGRELAEQLSALRPSLRILYVSGYTDDAILHHGVAEEGMHLLSKPFSPSALVQKVRDLLDQTSADSLQRPSQIALT